MLISCRNNCTGMFASKLSVLSVIFHVSKLKKKFISMFKLHKCSWILWIFEIHKLLSVYADIWVFWIDIVWQTSVHWWNRVVILSVSWFVVACYMIISKFIGWEISISQGILHRWCKRSLLHSDIEIVIIISQFYCYITYYVTHRILYL